MAKVLSPHPGPPSPFEVLAPPLWPHDSEGIFEALAVGVLLSGANGEVLSANPSARTLLGLAPDGIMKGVSLQRLLNAVVFSDEAGQPLSPSALPMAQAAQGVASQCLIWAQSRDTAERRILRMHARPLVAGHPRFPGVLTEIVDVTPYVESLQSLRQSKRRTDEHFDRLMRLHRVGLGLTAAMTVDALLPLLLTECIDAFSARGGSLYLKDDTIGHLSRKLSLGEAGEIDTLSRAIFAEAFLKKAPTVWEGPVVEETSPGPQPQKRSSGVLCLPVVKRGESVGLLVLVLDERPSPRRVEFSSYASLGEQMGLALERCELFESERKARADALAAKERAAFLADAGALLVRPQTLEEALSALCLLAVERRVDFCEVIRLTEWDGLGSAARAHVQAHRQESSVLGPKAPTGFGTGALCRALLHGRSQHLSTCTEEPHFLSCGLQVALVVPLKTGTRLLGALVMGSMSEAPFPGEEIELFEDLAQRTALAIDNARLHQEATASLRSRDHLLSILSHDVRTPLSVMQLKAQHLARALPAHSPLLEHVDAILKSGFRIGDLIRDLIDVASLKRTGGSLKVQPVAVKALLDEVIEKQTALSVPRRLVWEIEPAAAEWVCMVERPRLLRVFELLLDNAFQQSGPDGEVKVRVQKERECVEVSIIDQGPGLSPEAVASVFGRYWRAAPEVSQIGLGLFIARALVEAHKGTLELHSRKNHGIQVHFTLPLAFH